MHRPLFAAFCAASILLAPTPAAAVKRVAYPEIKVEPLPAFAGDAALDAMRKRLAEAVAKKDLAAVSTLVAPSFRWTSGGELVEDFDPKRDGIHNFKVAFGFRAYARDQDGPTEIGPQWPLLQYFAIEPSLTQEPGSPDVCGPARMRVVDPAALEQAFDRIDEPGDLSEWVYSLEEMTLTASPGGGAPVAKLTGLALPIVAVHPPQPGDGRPTANPPTHFELLLPTGKAGWAPVKGLRALFVDRLCYARTAGGEWRISTFDQAE